MSCEFCKHFKGLYNISSKTEAMACKFYKCKKGLVICENYGDKKDDEQT